LHMDWSRIGWSSWNQTADLLVAQSNLCKQLINHTSMHWFVDSFIHSFILVIFRMIHTDQYPSHNKDRHLLVCYN
jgi:hypothetical protein